MREWCDKCVHDKLDIDMEPCCSCDFKGQPSGYVIEEEIREVKSCFNCVDLTCNRWIEPCSRCHDYSLFTDTARTSVDLSRLVINTGSLWSGIGATQKLEIYDAVKRPEHYVADDGTEVKNVLTSFGYHKNSHRWNAGKYILRAGRKEPGNKEALLRDLRKAARSIEYEIDLIEKGLL